MAVEGRELTTEQLTALENVINDGLVPEGETLTRYVMVFESMEMETGHRGLILTHTPGMMDYEVNMFMGFQDMPDEEDE